MKKIAIITLVTLAVLQTTAQSDTSFMRYPPLPPKNQHLAKNIRMQRGSDMLLTNLIVFIRFADDEEFTTPLEQIDLMFNDTSFQAISVYNYFNVMTYGKINYRSVFTNDCQNSTIVSYQDEYPRSYYQPQSPDNPNGYTTTGGMATSTREYQLIANVIRHIDNMNLVDDDVNLDGNNDGYIDNISFIIKGNVGEWAELLWPHMDFFNSTSAGLTYTLTINGKIPLAYNFEFADSGPYFTANVFAHEMGHSMGLPDLYHYFNYPYIAPVGIWDQMAQNNLQQVSTILKYKFLGVVEEPIEIYEDGHYVLNSNTSADYNNCYFIRSGVDPDQWFTFEYRNCDDFMDNVPESGLIIGRWNESVDVNDLSNSGNGPFDFFNKPHSYWVFRPNSQIDTVNGNIYDAAFSSASGRTSFGPNTNPRPYLFDGTVDNTFEITNIYEYGNTLSFDVRFLGEGINSYSNKPKIIYPNPADDLLNIKLDDANRYEICDMSGRVVLYGSCHDSKIDISSLQNGMYMAKLFNDQGCFTEKFIKK